MTTNQTYASHIAVLLHSLAGGGAQRRTVALANAFAMAGRRVDLLTPADGELRAILNPQIRVRLLEPGAPQADLIRYLRKERPDALLAAAAMSHALAAKAHAIVPDSALVLRASTHPLRRYPWWQPIELARERLRRRGRQHRFAAADSIIAVAREVAAGVQRLAPAASVSVIPNPVIDENFLAGANRTIDLPWNDGPDHPLILGVGRVTKEKDWRTLLRAFARVRRKQSARLAIVGEADRNELARLKDMARTLGVADDVAFVGRSDAIASWLQRADLLVSSSLWEGSPGVLIEALAMGCPIVATDCPGGSRELLDDGRLGRLMPVRDPRAMADAITAELAAPHDATALKAAAEPYREGGQAADYLAVIDAAVRRKRAA